MSRRKIILNLCTSLDSYIEGPNGEYDWCFTDQDYSMTEFLTRIDTILFGRKSYEQLIKDAPEAFNDKAMVVFSTTMKSGNSSLKVISDNIEQEVQEIVNQPGGDIWLFGGAELTTTLLNLNLVDELMIAIHPLILSSGKPLFKNIIGRKQLELLDTKVYDTGLVQLFYTVQKGK